MKHTIVVLFSQLISLAVLPAQVVKEIVRLPSTPDILFNRSSVRTSRFGITLCLPHRGTDTSSTVFYLTKKGQESIEVQRKVVLQAVVVDTFLFLGIKSRYLQDSVYARINLDGSEWKDYLTGLNHVGYHQTISYFGNVLAGYSDPGGPAIIDTVAGIAVPTWPSIRTMGLSFVKFEPIGRSDGSVIILADVGHIWTRNDSNRSRWPGNESGQLLRFPGVGVYTATEIGDSVFYAGEDGICSMSLIDGGCQCVSYWAYDRDDRMGIAGEHGALYNNATYREPLRLPVTMNYYSKKDSLPLRIEFPELTDTTAVIDGGGWWDGKFYVAFSIDSGRTTVMYSITEPQPVVSVSEQQQAKLNFTKPERLVFTQEAYANWLAGLGTDVSVFDLLGNEVVELVPRPGVLCVRSTSSWWVVAVLP